MEKFVIYCKSFSRDINRYKKLVQSVKNFNKENLDFYTSVPQSDLNLFKNQIGTDYVKFVEDESIYNEIPSMRGWESQQIVKSSFWKLNVCENYLMIDSDSYFIKDISAEDFMFDDVTPYTVIHEQKDLFSWTSKNKNVLGFNPKNSFTDERKFIMNLFDRKGKVYDFGPGPVIWSKKVWESLEKEYLEPNELKFHHLIQQMPSEFSWYGEWLLYNNTIKILPIEPPFKFFHYYQQYLEYKNLGYTIEDWSENYIGVVMQSSSNLPLEY
jgi:hypothetical protein